MPCVEESLCGLCVEKGSLVFFSSHMPSHKYRIAGNFREVQIFAIFATHDQNTKIRIVKYETANLEIFTPCVLCASLAGSDV